MNANNSIQALQFFVTGLSNGAFAHLVQGKHFDSMGFKTLGKKYTDHYSEEMGWVEKFMTRINDLGGEVKIEDQKGRELVKDPVEYVKAFSQVGHIYGFVFPLHSGFRQFLFANRRYIHLILPFFQAVLLLQYNI